MFSMSRNQPHREESGKAVSLQIASLLIRILGPDLLERSHLLSRNRLRPTPRGLEHVGKVLHNNTGKHIDEDILNKKNH